MVGGKVEVSWFGQSRCDICMFRFVLGMGGGEGVSGVAGTRSSGPN